MNRSVKVVYKTDFMIKLISSILILLLTGTLIYGSFHEKYDSEKISWKSTKKWFKKITRIELFSVNSNRKKKITISEYDEYTIQLYNDLFSVQNNQSGIAVNNQLQNYIEQNQKKGVPFNLDLITNYKSYLNVTGLPDTKVDLNLSRNSINFTVKKTIK